MTNEYFELNCLVYNLRVLCIPIYSCFDYKTRNLNFRADGNVNRVLTTFYYVNTYKHLDIMAPSAGNDISWFIDSVHSISDNRADVVFNDEIHDSSKVQRDLTFAKRVSQSIDFSKYDVVICDSQFLTLEILDNHVDDLQVIYWCPVCAVDGKTRDFLEPHRSIDKYIFSRVDYTIISSKDQFKYIESLRNAMHGDFNITKTILIEQLIDRQLSVFDYKVDEDLLVTLDKYYDWKIIFLPFRLTDMGYNFHGILNYLTQRFKDDDNCHVCVLYTNPNNCDIDSLAQDEDELQFIHNRFIQVSKDRNTYYTIIDHGNVIIPYFEDTQFINHAAIYEFRDSNARVVNNLLDFDKLLCK